MAQYEAMVTSLLPNGKAGIVVRPDNPGIIDAPEISERLCHCATDSSIVRIEALNRANALVGDWVAVSYESSAVIKNVFFLIGVPLAGAIAGAALGSPLGGIATAVIAFAGALLGIVLGFRSYRRLSKDNLPVIDRIIKTRDEVAAAGRKNPGGCGVGCDRCVPWSL